MKAKYLKSLAYFTFCSWAENFRNAVNTLPHTSPSRVSFYVSWLFPRCQFLTTTFIKNISVSVVRCLHQCRHFGIQQHKMSWTTFMTSWVPLLDLHQQTVPDTFFIYVYIEEAIVTRRKELQF